MEPREKELYDLSRTDNIAELTEQSKSFDSEARASVASNENISLNPEIFETLSNDRSNLVLENLAGNPSTPIETLEVMVEATDKFDSTIVFRGDSDSEEFKDLIGKIVDRTENSSIMENVSQNENLNVETFDKLLDYAKENENSKIEFNLAENSSTPPDVLNELSKSDNEQVREAVISNDNTSIETLENLVNDSSASISTFAENTIEERNNPAETLSTFDTEKENGDTADVGHKNGFYGRDEVIEFGSESADIYTYGKSQDMEPDRVSAEEGYSYALENHYDVSELRDVSEKVGNEEIFEQALENHYATQEANVDSYNSAVADYVSELSEKSEGGLSEDTLSDVADKTIDSIAESAGEAGVYSFDLSPAEQFVANDFELTDGQKQDIASEFNSNYAEMSEAQNVSAEPEQVVENTNEVQVDEKQDLNINDFLDKDELNSAVEVNETSSLETEIDSKIETNSEVLDELSKSEDVDIRDSVASNENTPLDTLQEMAKNETNSDVLDSIVDNPQLNEQSAEKEFEEPLTLDERIAETNLKIDELNADPNVDKEELGKAYLENHELYMEKQALETVDDVNFLSVVKDTIDAGINEIKESFSNVYDSVKEGTFISDVKDVVNNWTESSAITETNQDKLDSLADKKDSIKEAVALNENASSATLDKIANTDTNADVKIAVASNDNTASQTLDKLFEDSSKFDQKVEVEQKEYAVAGKPDEKVSKLEYSVVDSKEGEQIREAIAGNKNTSENTLDKLSYDESASVRAEVGANEKSPEYVLDKLATDESKEVRASVLNNDTVSDKALGILSNDADNSIKESALAKIFERSAGQESSTDQKTDVSEDKREHWEKSMDESLAKVSEISEFKDVPETKADVTEAKEADVSSVEQNPNQLKDVKSDSSEKLSVEDAQKNLDDLKEKYGATEKEQEAYIDREIASRDTRGNVDSNFDWRPIDAEVRGEMNSSFEKAYSDLENAKSEAPEKEVPEAKADATEAKEAETPVEQKEERKGMADSFADTIKELDANPEKAHEMASHLEASANSDFAIDRASAEALDRLDQKTMADHEAKSEKGGMSQAFNDEVKRQEAENPKQEQTADVSASASEDKQSTQNQQQNIMRDAASF